MWCCVAVHMGAMLWSAVLHGALHSTQLLQPLHSPAPAWSHTSRYNNINQTLINSLTLGGLVGHQGIPKE